MSNLFWLDDESWQAIAPLIPMNRPGVKPGRNRQVISGIIHVLKAGCRWTDCPLAYGPSTTVYNRFNRWSKAGIWQKMADHLSFMMRPTFSASTAPPPRHIAVVPVAKGGGGARNRPEPRRANHENPRRCRWRRASDRVHDHPGTKRRHTPGR
jgi:transposase